MGNALRKQWENPGYYSDLVNGYVSNAGGFPVMIPYPEELLQVPHTCPLCQRSSGLKLYKMYKLLDGYRGLFRDHVDYVVAQRVANDDLEIYPNPYHGFAEVKDGNYARRAPLVRKLRNKINASMKVEEGGRGASRCLKKSNFFLKEVLDYGLRSGHPANYTPINPNILVLCGNCGMGLEKYPFIRQIFKKRENYYEMKRKILCSKRPHLYQLELESCYY